MSCLCETNSRASLSRKTRLTYIKPFVALQIIVLTYYFAFIITVLIGFMILSSFRQAAIDITTKYCQKDMEAYGSCVASNPSTWQQRCHELKMKVAQCTSSQ